MLSFCKVTESGADRVGSTPEDCRCEAELTLSRLHDRVSKLNTSVRGPKDSSEASLPSRSGGLTQKWYVKLRHLCRICRIGVCRTYVMDTSAATSLSIQNAKHNFIDCNCLEWVAPKKMQHFAYQNGKICGIDQK